MTFKTFSIAAVYLLLGCVAYAQSPYRTYTGFGLDAAKGSTCSPKTEMYMAYDTATPYICDGSGEWASMKGSSSSSSIPSGAILLIDSGTCPTDFTEVTGLSGKTLVGTVAANADVGGTGGSDTITPAGSVSAPVFTGTSNQTTSAVSGGTPSGIVSQPTFTGSALATHQHELPWQIASTTTIRQIAVATFGTGTSRAATAVSAAGTANTTSAAVAKDQPVSAGTPSGTVSQPTFTGSALGTHTHTLTPAGTNSAPSFTGTQFDNRSAFEKVIFCKKS